LPCPADSSVLRLNAAVTEAVRAAGGRILRAWEARPGDSGPPPTAASPEPFVADPLARLPGADPDACLWMAVGQDGEAQFLLCLRRTGSS
jgi:hypothetical protein